MQSSSSIKLKNKAIITLDNKLLEKQENKKNSFPLINFTSTSRALMALSNKQKFDHQVNLLYAKTNHQLSKKQQQQLQTLKSNKNHNQYQYHIQYDKDKGKYKFFQTHNLLHNNNNKLDKTLSFYKNIQKTMYQSKSLVKLRTKKLLKVQQKNKQETQVKLTKNKQQNPSNFNGQVKYSDKKFGFIQGYSVSSHVGKINISNNIRICIATNLYNHSSKAKQISFFGIFQGRNGPNRAQFMRQYFHSALISDQLIHYNFEKAVLRTLEKVNRDFIYHPKYEGDYSTVHSIICVIIGKNMYIIRWGSPNAIISMNFGSYIKSLYFQQKQLKSKQYILKNRNSISTLSSFNTQLSIPQQSVHIRAFELNQNFDYVILTNEGLQQVFNSKNQLGKIFWKYIVDQSVHTANINRLAMASNKVCEQAAINDNLGRSMSMIVIQFKNTSACLQNQVQLQLPYVTDKKMITNQCLSQQLQPNTNYLQKIKSFREMSKQSL